MVSQELSSQGTLEVCVKAQGACITDWTTYVTTFDRNARLLDVFPNVMPGSLCGACSIRKGAGSASDAFLLQLGNFPVNSTIVYMTMHRQQESNSGTSALDGVEVTLRMSAAGGATSAVNPLTFSSQGFDAAHACVVLLRLLRSEGGKWLVQSDGTSKVGMSSYLDCIGMVSALQRQPDATLAKCSKAWVMKTPTYNLRCGETLPIPTSISGSNHLRIAFGWEAKDAKLDVDISAVCLNEKGEPIDLIFFGHLIGCGGAIRHGGDSRAAHNATDLESLSVDLSKIPKAVHAVVFTMSVFSNGKNLSEMTGEYSRLLLVNGTEETELARVLENRTGEENGLLFVALTKLNSSTSSGTTAHWAYHAITKQASGRRGEELKPMCTSWFKGFQAKESRYPTLAPPREIRLVGGTNLKACDPNGLSDPFLKVYMQPGRTRIHQTAVCLKTLNPVWNETVKIPLVAQEIQFVVKDKDTFTDDHIGTVTLTGNDYANGTHTLTLKDESGIDCGSITYECL